MSHYTRNLVTFDLQISILNVFQLFRVDVHWPVTFEIVLHNVLRSKLYYSIFLIFRFSQVTFLESEKSELERRIAAKSPALSGIGLDRVDHIRTQIPLLSSASPGHGGSGSEHLVRIRILEQENERFLRKIRGLESQLSELEKVHGERIQELLQVKIELKYVYFRSQEKELYKFHISILYV